MSQLTAPAAPAVIPHVEQIPADAPVGASFWLVGKAIDIIAPGECWIPCGRCGGLGFIEAYGHVYEGVCFDCNKAKGSRSSIVKENKLAKARTKAAAKREAERVAGLAKREAAIAAIVEANPAVGTAIVWREAAYADKCNGAEGWRDSGLGGAEGFVSDLFRYNGDVPAWKIERIVEAVEALIERAAAEMAEALHFAASPAPVGKGCAVAGEIVSLKWVTNDFAYNSETPKILVVTDGGWKVYMTCPKKAFEVEGAIEGARIECTAELVEGRDGDPKFRIGKRPSKVTVTAAQ